MIFFHFISTTKINTPPAMINKLGLFNILAPYYAILLPVYATVSAASVIPSAAFIKAYKGSSDELFPPFFLPPPPVK